MTNPMSKNETLVAKTAEVVATAIKGYVRPLVEQVATLHREVDELRAAGPVTAEPPAVNVIVEPPQALPYEVEVTERDRDGFIKKFVVLPLGTL